MLQQAEELYRDVKSAGRHFPIEDVENSDIPIPISGEFYSLSKKEFKLAAMAPKERTLVMTQYNVSFRERWSGRMERTVVGSPTVAQPCARGTLVAEVTHVRDGDTIGLAGLPIRLNGLAAPEGDEPGGVEATTAMQQLVLGRELRCELDGERTHDRCAGSAT